jgi:regulatory protein SWI5
LTRHRQRGMCVGAFPDAVRRPAKRGRPKKNRPDMEERVTKANRTRRALASATSSVSAGSPRSDSYSEGSSPPRLHGYDATGLPKEFRDLSSFNEPMSSTADSFRYFAKLLHTLR